ncbi:MAG TPA: hypothetical protein VGX94_07435, partial [Terriglobia bacterium]|nr:hypothetical protein [Terriglobia bacterium]
LVYDFANCPGLPSYVSQPWMYPGEPNVSTDDTKFSDYFGGVDQGDTTLVTFYDRTANNGAGACYWYDTQTGMVGGTNMSPTPVANQVGQLPPPPAPAVTPNPGSGSLPAGTYYVKITAVTRTNPADGETTPSPEEGPIYLSAPGSLTVTLPSQLSNPSELDMEGSGCNPYDDSLSGCTPFNVYIGTAPGGETLQNTQGPVGGGYSQTNPLLANSAVPPSQSTAGYNVHGARLSRDGSYLRVDNQESQTVFFWQPGTNQVTTCLFIANSCGGHMALGYSHLINDPNDNDMAEVVIRPLSNLSSFTELVNPLPTPPQFTGSHWTWNDDNPSDTMPVCGSFYAGASAGQGDGTLSLLTNPLLQITAVYDREIACVATTGPSKVWRFAHTRASTAWNAGAVETSNFWATPRGNVSQDGKFYMFTSDWEWSLGDEQGTSGCPFSGECRTDVFIVELH